MPESIRSRLRRTWNAFMNRDPTPIKVDEYGSYGYSYRPDRPRLTRGNERTIVTSAYNRISLDVAAINYRHAQLDESKRYKDDIDDSLNNCLKLEANLDQNSRSFFQDVVLSLLDEGCVAIVPTDKIIYKDGTFDIEKLRTGKIEEWFPDRVRVRVYNERKGVKESIILPKTSIGIVENPLFAVINEPNSTMQRLIRKLALLDLVDEQSSSGKLDLIIQLPYVIKTPARQEYAEKRRKDIERQLSGTKYGIAYTDGTERITQLNRPLENNLLKQIEYLTELLYGQLGITKTVLDGTADERTMLNYYDRTVEPIVSAIVLEMRRKFLTKSQRDSGETILFFRDPFKLVPVNELAEISDKFTRNEIATKNEIRQVIGWKPSDDPRADELRNSNISSSNLQTFSGSPASGQSKSEEPTQT